MVNPPTALLPKAAPELRPRREPLPVRTVARALAFLLAGYMFFDKAFAYLHVPGTVLFVGELILAICAAYLLWSRPTLALTSTLPGLLLVVFVGYSLIRTVPFLPQFGFDAVRDAALYYYSAFALVAIAIVNHYGFERIASWYGRLQPAYILWAPAAIVLSNLVDRPFIPDSDVSVFSHRVSNTSVMLTGALLFFWLVHTPTRPSQFSNRAMLSALASLSIVFSGIANRGALVASVVGFALAGMLSRTPQRRHFLPIVVVTLTIALGVAWVTDLRLSVFSNNREVSVDQLIDNLGSVLRPGSGIGSGDLDGNSGWRMDFWTAIVSDVTANHFVLGLGYGENIAARYGFDGQEETFRSAHNSHISVFGRSGLIGIGIWGLMWWSWFYSLLRTRRRFLARGIIFGADVCAWLVVMQSILLMNATFDPTFETPMVGAWAWAIFGIGIAAIVAARPITTRIPIEARHSPI